MRRSSLSALLVFLAFAIIPTAQMRVIPLDEEQGHVALGLALRHLGNVGIFMHTTAHPDDENNGLLVMLNRGQGYRAALATATRGNGGQNEIGPEIFEALGVLRTGELAALHRFDGAEQYFTRAVDFGYSFSLEETFEKWGRDEITADYVRLIRMIRPDVIITLPPTGNAGGQHHMASAVITRDAYKLAGDPTKYPDQIKDGLRPWQPKKLYQSAGFGFPGEPATVGPDRANQLRGLRRAARQDLRGNRLRSPKHAQMPGDGPAPVAADRRVRGQLSARRNNAAGAVGEGRSVAVRRCRHRRDEPLEVRVRRAPKSSPTG
jgi:LmbE family N-acetylglucosaminyl deacetylase